MGWACPNALSSATSANLAFAPSQATRLGRECGAMLLLSKPTPRCAERDAPAKIQALFTREVYSITAFGSAQAVEERIEMALRTMGISSEVSLGRGMAELKAAAKRAPDEQRSASTLAPPL